MRRFLLVLLAAACLLPAPARGELGIHVGGEAGVGYSRTDLWLPWHRSGQGFDFLAALEASGGGLSPGLLVWSLGAEYQPRRSNWMGAVGLTHDLTFHLDLDGLRATPVPVHFSASRSISDSTATYEPGAEPRVGTLTATTVGGGASLRLDRLPVVEVGVNHTVCETRAVGVPDASATSTALTTAVSENLSSYQYGLGYDTGWSTGTWADTNYQSHRFTLNARVTPSDEVALYLRDSYYLRQPTLEAATNPRLDSNSLGTGVQWRPRSEVSNSLDYAYSHVLIQAPGAPEVETLAHSLGDSAFWNYSRALRFNGSATFGYGEERLGAASRKAGAEALGLGAMWQREAGAHSLTVGGGGSAGLVEPVDGAVGFSWGLTATATYTWLRDLTALTVTYSGGYQDGGASLDGWTMDHHLQARWDALVGRLALRGTLQGDYARRVDHLLGSTRTDGLRLIVDVYWRRLIFQGSAGITEGIAPNLAGPGSELLPSGYNTLSKYLAGSVGLTFDRGNLVLSLQGNATWVEAPGRPEQQQHGAALVATYRLGLTTFSLEDRYSSGGADGVWAQGNTVMARITRSFGFGF